MRLGISTGGGDCPGLNAVIRAVVKEARGLRDIEVVGIRDSFNGLMVDPIEVKNLEFEDVTDILTKGGTILGTHNRGNPYAHKDPKVRDERIQQTLDGAKKAKLDAMIVIGGDGTQSIGTLFHERGLPVIGIPKTIDNDLPGSDDTIGFASSVDIVTDAIERLQSTAESHYRLMILEVMGRNSGYIALHGGIAGGAHVVLMPEIPFDLDAVTQKIQERKKLGRNFSVVVVAEGAHEAGGDRLTKSEQDGKKTLGGIGEYVAKELSQSTSMETRVTVLGHVQRGGSPNCHDRILAARFAHHAVSLACKKKFGRCVAIKGNEIYDFPIEQLSEGRQRKVDLQSDTVAAAEAIGICLGRKLPFSTGC